MGSAIAGGERRAITAVENALNSPLLNDNDISGARHVLLNIMSGSDDIDMDEFGEITDYLQEAAGGTAELITGYGTDPSLGDNVSVTIIATGFKSKQSTGFEPPVFRERKIINLDEKPVVQQEEPKQTNIIDEIQENEPFLVVKEPVSHDEPKAVELPASVASIDDADFENETNLPVEFTFNEISDGEPAASLSEANQAEIENIQNETVTREEQIRLAQERIRKLKDITLKMKSPEGLAALEKQTAFERKNIVLENKTPSTESSVSRYTLSEGEDKKIEIRPNNSFLHDNVD
jgi:cell division protein FtsZ